ncbi:MAG: acetyltransferase [halophilic archaeon J07HX5]|nr:MAG: acetyltransferase [halophilic archaeon J07HX5]
MTAPTPEFRRYQPADADAVWQLHEWALRDAGTDPTDLPGVDDLRTIEQTYFDRDPPGAFIVGIVPPTTTTDADILQTTDGCVVAMGGLLPSNAGYDDERTVADAAELHRMRVAPSYQRNGYGRRLLIALEHRAQGRFDRLLATTADRQTAAVELYTSAEYERVGTSTYDEYQLVHFEKDLE